MPDAKIHYTLELIKQRANVNSFERGFEYYRQDAVSKTVKRGLSLEGYCAGSRPYHVQVIFDRLGIKFTHCTCPYEFGGDCKHIVALLLTYLYQPEKFVEVLPMREILAALPQDDLIEFVIELADRYPKIRQRIDKLGKKRRKS